MKIKKVKMNKIKKDTILATGDIVFFTTYKFECTLLDELTDGFVICIEPSHTYTYITRRALENHFLKLQ